MWVYRTAAVHQKLNVTTISGENGFSVIQITKAPHHPSYLKHRNTLVKHSTHSNSI